MFERFNFYDFYGYFVPGGFLCASLASFGYLAWILATGHPPTLRNVSLGDSVVLLFLAYVSGHVLQTLARAFKILDDPNRNLGMNLLRLGKNPEDKRRLFSEALCQRLHAVIAQRFSLPAVDANTVDEDACRERFNLAYSHVVTSKPGSYAQIYSGHYALYRGLYSVSWLWAWLVGITLAVWLAFNAYGILVLHTFPGPPQLAALDFMLLSLIVSWALLRPLRDRFQEFSANFAKEVLYETLALSVSSEGPRNCEVR